MKNIIFTLLAIIHYIIWGFVLLAFLNIKLANINLFMVIPFIYILHIFPFHLIEKAKENTIKDDSERKQELDNINKGFIIPNYFNKLQKTLGEKCFCNPISPQGMLIFGALSCAFVLKYNKNIIRIK
jgi:hypothetical protein